MRSSYLAARDALAPHTPTSLLENFDASSPIGYWNNTRGASGTTAAIVIIASRRGPIVIHRIPFRTLTALSRSASDLEVGGPATARLGKITIALVTPRITSE